MENSAHSYTEQKMKYFYNWDDSGWFMLYQQTPHKTNVLHCFEGYPGDGKEQLVKQISDALNLQNVTEELKAEIERLKSNTEIELLVTELKDLCEEHITGRIGNYGFYASIKTLIIKYSEK